MIIVRFHNSMVSTYGRKTDQLDSVWICETCMLLNKQSYRRLQQTVRAELPTHSCIYQFMDILRIEHEYQYHVADGSQV